MEKKLIVFDVDGVLLDNRMGGFKDILIISGKIDEVQRLDKIYQKRKHFSPWGLKELAKLYKGLSEEELRKMALNYCCETLRKGAKEVLERLKEKGYLMGALSSNPQFVMDALSKILPLDFSGGTRLKFKNGIATGGIQKKIDRYGKAKILEKIIKNYRLKKKNVIVVGDSITDLPMAEKAGAFIAFYPKENIVKEKANKIVRNFPQLEKLL